ncbi:MAG TPA: GMC family oxidoreductase [Candidatus Kapabacteria bacterium]|nr:GMC family oxidoreductase [Candidatus Kapabacteria bacterium]
MNTIDTDVLVIGSGFGAAAPALRLAEAGLTVTIIEKGPDIVPERDFRQTQDPGYLLAYLKGEGSDTVSFTYAEALGGGSGFYEMVSLRAPSIAFEQRDAFGRRLWPHGIDRRSLDPYFDEAERMLNVEQIGVDEIPKSGVAFAMLMKNLGYSCDRARYAVRGCVGSGFCISGCLFGAKQSLHLNYLPAITAAGARVMTGLEAIDIRTIATVRSTHASNGDIDTIPLRYVVQCRGTAGEMQVRAKIVVLGGGTIGTAKLLLRSRPYLRRLSAHVGRNIAFNGSVKAVGILPEGFIEGDMATGRSHPGMISYQFLEERGITVSSIKPLPITLVGTAHLALDRGHGHETYWGESHVEMMKISRRRMIVLYALGLTPPGAGIRRLGNGEFEPWLDIDETLARYYHETSGLLDSILSRNGCEIVRAKTIDAEGTENGAIHFDTSHMIGSCRMADTRDNGVVDASGEVFGYPGLYVSDGAAVPTSLAVNSSLTILANAERIARGMVMRYGGATAPSLTETSPP